MPQKREFIFEKGIPYHIVSRAVEERNIFRNEEDMLRFIFQSYVVNIGRPKSHLSKREIIKLSKAILEGAKETVNKKLIIKHPPLVVFFSFVLVGNHYHFGIIPLKRGSVSLYIQKLNTSFAMFYNKKYHRKGTLFGSRFKAIPIKSPFQLDALIRYINIINVLDVFDSNWREKGLKDEKTAFKFLANYYYSSFPDIFGNRNSLLVSKQEISKLEKFLGKDLSKNFEKYLKSYKDFFSNKIKKSNLFLE